MKQSCIMRQCIAVSLLFSGLLSAGVSDVCAAAAEMEACAAFEYFSTMDRGRGCWLTSVNVADVPATFIHSFPTYLIYAELHDVSGLTEYLWKYYGIKLSQFPFG